LPVTHLTRRGRVGFLRRYSRFIGRHIQEVPTRDCKAAMGQESVVHLYLPTGPVVPRLPR